MPDNQPLTLSDHQVKRLLAIAITHGRALGRLQLFAETARLGFDYIPILREIQEPSPLTEQLEAYRNSQEKDFYDLHAVLVVRMWSILETFVRDICAFLIETVEPIREQPSIRSIKGPLVEFSKLSEEQKADKLLRYLEDKVGASMNSGVGRFEKILEPLGLKGPVDGEVRRALHECANYRNCITHNDGIIDDNLSSSVPLWSHVKGRRLGLTTRDTRRILFATSWYMLEIQKRLLPNAPETLKRLQEEQDNYLYSLRNPDDIPERSMPFTRTNSDS